MYIVHRNAITIRTFKEENLNTSGWLRESERTRANEYQPSNGLQHNRLLVTVYHIECGTFREMRLGVDGKPN